MTDQKNTAEVDPVEVQQELHAQKFPIQRISIDQMAMMTPQRAAQIMEIRVDSLKKIREAAIRGTAPEDWVGFRDNDGNVAYLLTSSGAVKVRKYYGISTLNVRPEIPDIIENEDGSKVATIVGDGVCTLTGEETYNICGMRRSTEHFVGRGTDEDLRQAARTSLETKIVRILAGMIRVPDSELGACGLDLNKTRKGSGFGTSSERKAGAVAPEEVRKLQADLQDKLTRYAAGDTARMAAILIDITKQAPTEKNPKGFRGYDKVSAMTLDWAIKRAIERIDVLLSEEGGAE
jgi:hypothetical protein